MGAMDYAVELLSGLGYALDTPGALLRGALAGRPGERRSGREMLEDWGALGENQEGLDAGDVAGFFGDMVFDPLNLIPGAGLAKLAGKAKVVKNANRASESMRAAGAMPEEIARLTKIVDESGAPMRVYHGTPHSGFDLRDMSLEHSGKTTGNEGWFGRGLYFTPDKDTATHYSKMRYDPYGKSLFGKEQGEGRVLEAFVDSRQPFETTFHRAHGDLRRAGISSTLDKYGVLDDPAGITDELRSRGFDSVFAMGDGAELSVFDPSQVYLPYIAPELQKTPDIRRLVAMLTGYNAIEQPYHAFGER